MTLRELLFEEAGGERWAIAAAASLAGVANVLILAGVNALAQDSAKRDWRALVIFAVLILLYYFCARYTSHRTTELIENILHRIKVRIGDKIARTELASLERVRAAEVCDRITENMMLISDRAGLIATLANSAVVMTLASVYIFWLSPPAFALIALLCSVGAVMFVLIRKRFVAYSMQSAGIRITFLERMTDLLSGFKEVQLSRQRGRELRADIFESSACLRDVSVKSNNFLSDGQHLGEGVLFAMLAAVVYTLRMSVAIDTIQMVKLTAVVMFIWGPFMGVASGIMPYIRSSLALSQIAALEQRLAVGVDESPEAQLESLPRIAYSTRIELKDVTYTHVVGDAGERFSIGPLSLTIYPGEVLFIVGGNGSGKSTFLKVLTGLYPPETGTLYVGDSAITAATVSDLRDQISAIFSDFHLFAKLYGIRAAQEADVHQLLVRMKLDKKTSFVNGRFTNLALSTGQKKRLAMLVALLEDRPICVFDEWAADQDPEFRKHFYEELLPQLKQEGKTVIVVSHDDRYFHCADRVVTMEYGKIHSITTQDGGRPALA